jgi:hypothetical protein
MDKVSLTALEAMALVDITQNHDMPDDEDHFEVARKVALRLATQVIQGDDYFRYMVRADLPGAMWLGPFTGRQAAALVSDTSEFLLRLATPEEQP